MRGDEYKNEEVYVTYPITDYVVTDHALRITDHALPLRGIFEMTKTALITGIRRKLELLEDAIIPKEKVSEEEFIDEFIYIRNAIGKEVGS